MRERETREKQTKRKRTAGGVVVLSSVLVFSDFLFRLSFLYFRKTIRIPPFIYTVRSCIYIAALFYFYHTLRTKNTVTVVPFYEKVFSFDLFARVLRIPLFASRLLWRDFERQIGWTAHKHSEREKKKAILAAVSNFESDDRAIVPAKSARVQIRDDFLIHAFASRMICARFLSLHIRVVVPGGAREVNREKSKIIISEREMRVEATAVRSFFA